jgi:hypothetical protein
LHELVVVHEERAPDEGGDLFIRWIVQQQVEEVTSDESGGSDEDGFARHENSRCFRVVET